MAVVGLGYVGLPVAVAFGKQRADHRLRPVDSKRIENLRHVVDATGEVSTAELMAGQAPARHRDRAELEHADFIIVAVPTPVNAARQPDFGPLESASEHGRAST